MAKSLMKTMRKHRKTILVVIVTIMILLIILGFAMSNTKTWGPREGEKNTRIR